ncbi:MAG TPA: phosphate ABC transporter permease subunit PstC, partial [Candidatus Thermoplasmatota archaeon]|nr:phosphate ABC transporter permease subunit PstC [Candidatus Thermoplasmatota archaeon]
MSPQRVEPSSQPSPASGPAAEASPRGAPAAASGSQAVAPPVAARGLSRPKGRWSRSLKDTFFPPRESTGDRAFRILTGLFAVLVASALLWLVSEVFQEAWPAFQQFGPGLITSDAWDPQGGNWGALPFLWGTLYTSLIALVLAVPIALGVALFLTEFSPRWLRAPLGTLVELLAGVPSIVYGLWGVFAVAPFVRDSLGPFLHTVAPWLPLGDVTIGYGYLTAGIVLAIMILPTITAISRDAILAVPRDLREAAYALGSTRWEVARRAVLPTAKVG